MSDSNADGNSVKSTTCCCPSQVHSSIDINASPESIWNVLMDGPNYNTWNPFLKDCTFTMESAPGDIIAASLEGKFKFEPKVIAHNKNDELIWRGNFLCDCCCYGEHVFKVEPKGPNTTHFIQYETFGGCLSNICCCIYACCLLEPTSTNFQNMNNDLKKYVEKKEQST